MSLRLKESEIDGKQGDSGEGASYLIWRSNKVRQRQRANVVQNCELHEHDTCQQSFSPTAASVSANRGYLPLKAACVSPFNLSIMRLESQLEEGDTEVSLHLPSSQFIIQADM